MTEAHVIFVKGKTKEDSNYLTMTKYKNAIKKLIHEKGIKFLADIHEAKQNRPYKVNVGIIDKTDMKKCSCPTFKNTIEEAFKEFQTILFNLDSFTAGTPCTVTYFARHECGIEAAQFEINAKYRIIERKPDSSKAVSREEPDFKAGEKDVLEFFKNMEKMILKISHQLRSKE